jgi:hypothetical protein
MNHVIVFRTLIALFACLYVAAMSLGSMGSEAPVAAQEYERWLSAQPRSAGLSGFLCLFGHLLDAVGLVLLFIRRRLGLWFIVLGFVSCLGTSSGYPFLQTNLGTNLMAFTNIAWGALVCMAVVCRKEIFYRAPKA